jgi:hypothetical protein
MRLEDNFKSGGSFVQQIPYQTPQPVPIQRFLDEMNAPFHGLTARTFDIPGHEKHSETGTPGSEDIGQHAAGHSGHDEIGQEQVDLALLFGAHLQRFRAGRCLNYIIALGPEHVRRHFPNRRFVINDEQCFF